MPDVIHHALVLNLHQPPNNLQHLLSIPNPKGEDGWECKEILFAMDRIARSLWDYEDRARVHLALSGTLLETLADPDFQDEVYGVVKLGDMLWHWQNDKMIDILGTGYYHPVLPLIPEADRKEHLKRWQGIAGHLFPGDRFRGFWPSEMGFSMELIPLLKSMGYRYVLVDSKHVKPVDPEMSWEELRYRPHFAKYDGEEMIVIVRDRDLSDAQESGMDLDWFANELAERTKFCDFVPLVTTATDGDNGGWFRNFRDQSNFWNAFYIPMLEREAAPAIDPIFIHDYIDRYGVGDEVTVDTGAWNTGWHNGVGFTQWTGSDAQKDALERIQLTSDTYHKLHKLAKKRIDLDAILEEAHWRILRAETSCNIYWGEAWVYKVHNDLDAAWPFLHEAAALLGVEV